MKHYFGTPEDWLNHIESIRNLGFHATGAPDMQYPYGRGSSRSEGSEIKTIEQIVNDHMRQEASPA